MSITSLDLLIAGMRPPVFFTKVGTGTQVTGRPTSLWSLSGTPGAGAFDATLNGVVLSSTSALVDGQLRHSDPATGNAHLARLSVTSTVAGFSMLLDRLWHNGGYDVTLLTAQNSTTPTWPSRCPTSGTDDTPATTGLGVMLAVEVSVVTGVGTPTITIGYTNQAGVAGRTATNVIATVATAAVGATYLIGLQAGDTGVRSVQSLTLSATWTSGTIHLVAYRMLAMLESPLANVGYALDAVTGGMPRLYNGVVPWLLYTANTTTSQAISGTYMESHG